MQGRFGSVGICESRYCSVVIELDSLSRAGKPIAAWDAEVGDTAVVEDITLRGSLEGFLVLEDSIFESLDPLSEAVELHRRVGLAVGDGGEEAVCNGAKEHHVEVVVGGKDGLCRPRRHCQWCWSRQARDWKGCRRLGGR